MRTEEEIRNRLEFRKCQGLSNPAAAIADLEWALEDSEPEPIEKVVDTGLVYGATVNKIIDRLDELTKAQQTGKGRGK